MSRPDAIVVGAGLAGLSCAVRLVAEGRSVLVLEASERPGGRVKTDEVDGFLIDRGFQTLLESYPEARATLDLEALDSGAFRPGAVVRRDGAFHTLSDPRRHLGAAWTTLTAPVGTMLDRWRMARFDGWLQRRVEAGHGGDATVRAMVGMGFSRHMIDAFLRPFLGGVFLECELKTPMRQLAFVWNMFSQGDAVLPTGGMEAIPRQLAARLPEGALRCGVEVASVEPGAVTLTDGQRLEAGAVVVAVEGPAARRLLGQERLPDLPWRSVSCLSFDAPSSPVDGPWLVLGGDFDGPINNLCVPSDVNPSYAPEGRALVSATVLDEPYGGSDELLEAAVRRQLTEWYGEQVAGWRTLRIDRIKQALPVVGAEPVRPDLPRGLHVAGDHLDMPSIQHAMASGRVAAEAVHAELDAAADQAAA